MNFNKLEKNDFFLLSFLIQCGINEQKVANFNKQMANFNKQPHKPKNSCYSTGIAREPQISVRLISGSLVCYKCKEQRAEVNEQCRLSGK
jgi:hypothetical protein